LVRQAAPGAALADLLNLFRSTATPAPDLRPGAASPSYPAINLLAALGALGHAPPGVDTGGIHLHGLATPERLVDTRIRLRGPRVGANGLLAVSIPGVPVSGASPPAASLNVTAVDADGPGFLTVFPCGTSVPLVSNVNYSGATPVANKVVVAVPADSRVCVFSMTSTDVVVDFDGWLEPNRPFVPLEPTRKIDTRPTGVRVTNDLAVAVAPPG